MIADLIIRLGLWIARLGMRLKTWPDETLPYLAWIDPNTEQHEWEVEVGDDGTVIETEVTRIEGWVE
jgi:hypothetical protein